MPRGRTELGELLAHGIGARVREVRLARGMTQAQLAARACTFRPIVARIEGGRHAPDLATLRALAVALELSLAALLEGVRWGPIEDAARASLEVVP